MRSQAEPPTGMEQGMSILSDTPDARNRIPGRGDLAERLAELIHKTRKRSCTMGILGDWGSGKTSLMLQMRASLKARGLDTGDRPVYTVWFSPWEYQGCQDLVGPLVAAMARDVAGFREAKARERLIDFGKTVIARTLSGGLKALTKGVADVGDAFEQLMAAQDDTPSRDEFARLVREAVTEEGRLVVFVDDLDRCVPMTALALLEAVKLFLEVERCCYVLGATPSLIESAVGAYFQGKGLEGGALVPSEYLEKMIHTPVWLGELETGDAAEYCRALLKDLGIEASEAGISLLAQAGRQNPRRLKRLVNAISVMRTVGGHSGFNADAAINALVGTDDPGQCARLAEMAWYGPKPTVQG